MLELLLVQESLAAVDSQLQGWEPVQQVFSLGLLLHNFSDLIHSSLCTDIFEQGFRVENGKEVWKGWEKRG